jgi:hypothetical protein
MMRHLLALLLATTTLAAPAVAVADIMIFVTVDSTRAGGIGNNANTVRVTGRLEGQEAARTIEVRSAAGESVHEQCNRQAIIAMSKPGRWHFVVEGPTYANEPNRIYARECGLTRID